MKKYIRRVWELDIGKKIANKDANINRFKELISKSVDIMQNKAESELNPCKYNLSDEAKRRLKWMYIIQFECKNNISRAAKKTGVSRQWLSKIHSHWEDSGQDPRSLELESRAPNNTDNRKKIDAGIKDKIVEVREKYHWGKDKLVTILETEYKIIVGASTINRHLNKKGLINVKISNRIKMAHRNIVEQRQKYRPPKEIKDYKPGALIEKDMKFILKTGVFINFAKYKAKENFWNQHTVIDSFTRIRTLGLAENGDSQTAVAVQEECVLRLPFNIACANTDNGSENEKDFDKYLKQKDIIHFYSRSGTPTDNPRVERSHLTDEVEFYQQGNICKTFEEQKQRLADWEYLYNYVRPHQALGNLTPMAFYELWKDNSEAAYKIVDKWQKYLRKQSERLANSRKIKSKEKIAKMMVQIDLKLANSYV
jgi:transposase InsO family protein